MTIGPAADLRNALQVAYAHVDAASHFARAPDWAFQLPATIPFVGARYGEQANAPRILIYASAENIQTQIGRNDPWLADGHPGATDRHALAWRGDTVAEGGTRVGIAPFEDGPLRAAAALLWKWERERFGQENDAPGEHVEVTERVAVANLSKFALPPHEGTNRDVKSVRHLLASMDYVCADTRELSPSIVLVAKSLPSTIAEVVAGHAAPALVIWLPQASGIALTQPAHLRRAASLFGGQLPERKGDTQLAALHHASNTQGWSAWRGLLRLRYLAAVAIATERQRLGFGSTP